MKLKTYLLPCRKQLPPVFKAQSVHALQGNIHHQPIGLNKTGGDYN